MSARSQPCKYWQQGYCRNGSRCSFAHGLVAAQRAGWADDGRGRQTNGAEASDVPHPLYKTQLCEHWIASQHCDYGSECNFAHGQEELRVVPPWYQEVARTRQDRLEQSARPRPPLGRPPRGVSSYGAPHGGQLAPPPPPRQQAVPSSPPPPGRFDTALHAGQATSDLEGVPTWPGWGQSGAIAEAHPGRWDALLKTRFPAFVCPLSRELFVDPVTASDGYTYERANMEDLLFKQQLSFSPVTQAELVDKALVPNEALKKAMGDARRFLELLCSAMGMH